MSSVIISRALQRVRPAVLRSQVQRNHCNLWTSANRQIHTSSATAIGARVTHLRSMATAATVKNQEWLVILPDHEGAIQKRLEVRQYVVSTRLWMQLQLTLP